MPRRFSIKAKLTLATLIPLMVAIGSCWLVGVFILNTRIVAQVQDKVRNDLNTARESYSHEVETIRDVVRFTAVAPSTSRAIGRCDREALAAILIPLLKNEHLDIFTAVDATGTVILRAGNPAAEGDSLIGNPFVARALKGETVSGTDVIPAQRLAFGGPHLTKRAVIPVIPTPYARPRQDREERSGMVLVAAAPVRDDAGNVVGSLYAGVLLNNNNQLVDRIRNIAFESSASDAGGASIFLGDLRIATNVRHSDGTRAIGTQMSEEVFNRVLLKREKWFGPAFVVNDWYFSAYEPIVSPAGVPIGALYVGMPEKPVLAVKLSMGLLYSGVLLIGGIVGLAASSFSSSRLARPIRELERLAKRVAAGERDIRITVAAHDEIGDLATEFNSMTAALAEKEEEIRSLNRGLEEKVRQRTTELEEKNRQLVATREELLHAEKLAAVGELAAGVAHEINNPLAIIRGNAEILEMDLPPDSPNHEEVGIITRQVGRVERIVGGLLRFARREEQHPGPVQLNRLLDEVISQIGHQVSLDGVTIRRDYDDDLAIIDADGDQLRQVCANLIANAIQAMPDGGTLTISTRQTSASGTCTIAVADTGVGIPAEHLQKLFNPFFTTRSSGTGLGLAVSYGIVREHGGTIEVTSSPGEGSLFLVTLPIRRGAAV